MSEKEKKKILQGVKFNLSSSLKNKLLFNTEKLIKNKLIYARECCEGGDELA